LKFSPRKKSVLESLTRWKSVLESRARWKSDLESLTRWKSDFESLTRWKSVLESQGAVEFWPQSAEAILRGKGLPGSSKQNSPIVEKSHQIVKSYQMETRQPAHAEGCRTHTPSRAISRGKGPAQKREPFLARSSLLVRKHRNYCLAVFNALKKPSAFKFPISSASGFSSFRP